MEVEESRQPQRPPFIEVPQAMEDLMGQHLAFLEQQGMRPP